MEISFVSDKYLVVSSPAPTLVRIWLYLMGQAESTPQALLHTGIKHPISFPLARERPRNIDTSGGQYDGYKYHINRDCRAAWVHW